MNFNEYQIEARKTAVYPKLGNNYTYVALGLGGEVGEILEKFKKLERDHNNILTDEYKLKIAAEFSDCLWYLSNFCSELQIEFKVIAAEINNFNDYQQRTPIYNIKGNLYIYVILGLGKNAGDILGLLQDVYADKLTEDCKNQIIDKLYNCLWYLSSLCTELKISLEDIAQMNLKKLADRQARGMLKGEGDNR